MKKTFTLLVTVLLLFAVPFGALAAGEEKIVAKGIDVSSSGQGGKTDFQKVKSSGIDFVILAAGFSGNGKGDKPSTDTSTPPTVPSTYFEKDYANAEKAGLKIGIYYYSYAQNTAEAICDAKDVLRFIKGKKIEYPIYYDLEDRTIRGLSKQKLTEIALAFTTEIQKAGYMAGIYASLDWFETKLDYNTLSTNCEIWLAQWNSSHNLSCGLWQYSDTGKVGGISGNVDLNYAYRDYPTLIRLKGLNGFAKNTYKPAAEKQDINCDGELNLKDAALLARYTAGQSNLELNESVVSYNGSGAPANLKNVVELVRRLLAQN